MQARRHINKEEGKLYTNNFFKHTCKNPQHNINKLNVTLFQKELFIINFIFRKQYGINISKPINVICLIN